MTAMERLHFDLHAGLCPLFSNGSLHLTPCPSPLICQLVTRKCWECEAWRDQGMKCWRDRWPSTVQSGTFSDWERLSYSQTIFQTPFYCALIPLLLFRTRSQCWRHPGGHDSSLKFTLHPRGKLLLWLLSSPHQQRLSASLRFLVTPQLWLLISGASSIWSQWLPGMLYGRICKTISQALGITK